MKLFLVVAMFLMLAGCQNPKPVLPVQQPGKSNTVLTRPDGSVVPVPSFPTHITPFVYTNQVHKFHRRHLP